MMVMTSRWLTLAEASARLDIPEFEVLDLAVSGRLHSRVQYDHREVCAADVEEFAAELLGRAAIPVRQGRLDEAGEQQYRDEQRDFDDTPNDEGDDGQ